MHWRMCSVLLLVLSSCASTPPTPTSLPPSTSRPQAIGSSARSSSGSNIRLVSGSSDPNIQFASGATDKQSPIRKSDLDNTRALLNQARGSLDEKQWAALNSKFIDVEKTFVILSKAAEESGQAAEVARGTEGFSQFKDLKQITRLPLGPLFAALIVLWPASTASPSQDQPSVQQKLRDLVVTANQIAKEVRESEENAEEDLDSDVLMAAKKKPRVYLDWWEKTNPKTGQFYASEEEYDRFPQHRTQTCDNKTLDRLEKEKDALGDAVVPYDDKVEVKSDSKKAKVPCSRLKRRIESLQALIRKREDIQETCYKGNPDGVHQKAIGQLKQGLESTRELEKANCAPGHPLADK